MRIVPTIVLAALFGLATGMGSAILRVNSAPWDGDPGGKSIDAPLPDLPVPGEPVPKLAVNHTKHDFGSMELDKEGTHDFVFSNEGDGNLVLGRGRKSCGCVVTEFEGKFQENKIVIRPGKSSKVTVKWRPDGKTGPYTQTAEINTNDDANRKVKLTITGKVTTAVKAVPSEVTFDRISAGETAARSTSLFCYLDEPPLEVIGHSWARNSTAEHFEVTFLPLTSDQLQQEPGAKSGQLLEVTVKPGLPLGTIRQAIFLRTNLKADMVVEVPIVGSIGRDIAIAGGGWNDVSGVLDIGPVASQEGAQRTLIIITRGPHHKQVRFTAGRCDPELLEIELGETIESDSVNITRTPLTVRIPKGSPRAKYLGTKLGELGRILIQTTHPNIPELTIRVSFAVTD